MNYHRVPGCDDVYVVDVPMLGTHGTTSPYVIDAPGHAPHQLCFYDHHTDALFGADACGMRFDGDHRPTTPPPNFDLEATLDTVDRLLAFEPETVLYAHFGPGVVGEGVAELYDYTELL